MRAPGPQWLQVVHGFIDLVLFLNQVRRQGLEPRFGGQQHPAAWGGLQGQRALIWSRALGGSWQRGNPHHNRDVDSIQAIVRGGERCRSPDRIVGRAVCLKSLPWKAPLQVGIQIWACFIIQGRGPRKSVLGAMFLSPPKSFHGGEGSHISNLS